MCVSSVVPFVVAGIQCAAAVCGAGALRVNVIEKSGNRSSPASRSVVVTMM
jgi:hypothetical protein